ncbi:MAG: hypothetical protein OEY22_01170 [Candidatus Bathyarchaeota archaeon]|nr:hypothetical protein [Candidatus Bathyarchaeota archaeon]MDH5788114.1 hypothetical protein [Candidatus Bathyarchaeota archaeon]
MTKKQPKMESETPFIDWVKEENPVKKRLLDRFLDQAKLEKKLDRLIPEPQPTAFKEKVIESLKVEAIEKTENGEKQFTQYTMQKPQKTSYIIRKNPNLTLMIRLNKNKIYYDAENDAYFEYVISNDRKRLLQKNRLDKHETLNMLAFSLVDIYGGNIPKRVYISKELRQKIEELIKRIDTQLGQNSHCSG